MLLLVCSLQSGGSCRPLTASPGSGRQTNSKPSSCALRAASKPPPRRRPMRQRATSVGALSLHSSACTSSRSICCWCWSGQGRCVVGAKLASAKRSGSGSLHARACTHPCAPCTHAPRRAWPARTPAWCAVPHAARPAPAATRQPGHPGSPARCLSMGRCPTCSRCCPCPPTWLQLHPCARRPKPSCAPWCCSCARPLYNAAAAAAAVARRLAGAAAGLQEAACVAGGAVRHDKEEFTGALDPNLYTPKT